MKTYIGLFILVMLLVAASGCTTQQAKPAATATTLTTTVAATEVPTDGKHPPADNSPDRSINDSRNPGGYCQRDNGATPRPSMTPSTKITTIHIRNNTFVPGRADRSSGNRYYLDQ